MDLNRLKTIEEFVIEVRTSLGFDNYFNDVNKYQLLTFDTLSEAIMKVYPDIMICDIRGHSSKYYVKNKKIYIEIPKDLDDFSRLQLLSSSYGAHVLDKYCTDTNIKEYASLFMYALILPRELFYKSLDLFADCDATVQYKKIAEFLCLPDAFVINRGRHLMVW